MNAPRQRKKQAAQASDGTSHRRTLWIGVAGQSVAVTGEDAPSVLGDDPSGQAQVALRELCEAGCDQLVLLYVLTVMRYRLPCFWWDGGESKERAKRRRDDAVVLDRAAAIITEQYAFFLPRENMTAQDQQNLRAWDELAIWQGSVSPLRLLLGVESLAERLRAPDASRRAAAFRANQNDFDVISRSVFCTYVQRTSGDWHDREVAVLLAQVGNHKADRRKAVMDANGLRQWRAKNQGRLAQLSSWAVDQLVQYSVESPSSK